MCLVEELMLEAPSSDIARRKWCVQVGHFTFFQATGRKKEMQKSVERNNAIRLLEDGVYMLDSLNAFLGLLTYRTSSDTLSVNIYTPACWV